MTTNVPDSVDELIKEIRTDEYGDSGNYKEQKLKAAIQKHTDAAIRQAFAEVLGELPEKKPAQPLEDTEDEQFYEEIGFNQAIDTITALLKRRMES